MIRKPILLLLSIVFSFSMSVYPFHSTTIETSLAADQSMTYSTLLDLDFERIDDLYFLGEEMTANANLVMKDNTIELGNNGVGGLGSSFNMNVDTGVYIRFKLNSEGTCFTTLLGAGYEGCGGLVPEMEVMDHGGFIKRHQVFSEFEIPEETWLGSYSWTTREIIDGRTEIVSYLSIWNDESPNEMMISKGIIPHTDSERMMLPGDRPFMLMVWSGLLQVDKLMVIRDDHLGFLAANAGGFSAYEDEIRSFFSTTLTDSDLTFKDATPDDAEQPSTMSFGEFFAVYTKIVDAIEKNTSREGAELHLSVETNRQQSGIFITAIHRDFNDFWIRVHIENMPNASEDTIIQYMNDTNNAVIINPIAPKVGDFSVIFQADPSIHIIFVKGGLMVEIMCPLVYKNVEQQFTPESLTIMAEAIADAIPEGFQLPKQIPTPDAWHEDTNLFELQTVGVEGQNIKGYLKTWIPSIELVTYYDLEDRVSEMKSITDMDKLGRGWQSIQFIEEWPNQMESVWMLVDGKIIMTVSKNFLMMEQQ